MKTALATLVITYFNSAAYTQNVGIGTTTPKATFNVASGRTVLFGADTSGTGSKLIWYPTKSAFRAGRVASFPGTAWDNVNVGDGSFATGVDNLASGQYSIALGYGNEAVGGYTTAIGFENGLQVDGAIAIGRSNNVFGESSTAIGFYNYV